MNVKARAFAVISALFFFAAGAHANDVAELIKKGDVLDKQFKTSDALAVFLDAAKIAPENAEVLYRVAREYGLLMDDVAEPSAKREKGLEALDYAKHAVVADETNAMAHLALAISYGRVAPFLDNKTKIAYSKLVKDEADKALRLDPANDLTYHVLGAWNYEMANLNPVLRMMASAIYGSFPPASNEAAVLDLKKAVALNPARVANYVELGRAYAAMKQNALAAENLKKGLGLPNREKDDDSSKQRARDALQKL